MTQFKDAFGKAGLPKHENDFSLALARFLNSGGTIERAFAIVDAAAIKMGKKGHPTFVQQDQFASADLSRPTPSEGQNMIVHQDRLPHADARQLMPDADPRGFVQQDQVAYVSVGHPLPEGHDRPVQQDQTPLADGHPIPSESQTAGVQSDQVPPANAGKPIASAEGRDNS